MLRENRVRLAAEVTSRVPVDTLELIQNGVVIESSSGPRVEKEVTLDRSAWFAVRVSGKPARGFGNDAPRAHSAPVYVSPDGKPVLIREDLELMIRWLGRFWANLEERDNFGPAPNRANARKMFNQAIAHYEAKLKGL